MKKKWIRDAIYFGVKTKTWKIMRLSAFFLFLFAAQVWAGASYSQQTKLTLKMNNARVIDVLDEIENRSEFYFLFNQKLVDVERKVDVDVKEKPIDNILSGIFSETNVSYLVKDRFIVLTTEKQGVSEENTLSQQSGVSGRVIDQSGQPLPGVTVLVKGTTQGMVTNVDGEYSIPNIPENATLQFSFVGMRTQEVAVGSQTTINISMVEDAIGIEEVVAIGYGTQRKATVTGSVAGVSEEELVASPSLNVTSAISGLMPGVITKVTSGEPGRENSTILIRGMNTTGDNSPLVVVDGIQDVSGWERINSNDIESISVLKDASAAIYGARAANGVILITTKRGSVGKPTISYSINQAIAQPTRIPKLAESADFAGYVNQLDIEAGQSPRYSEDDIAKFRSGTDPNFVNEDWYGKTLKNTSSQSQHNLNVRGGTEHTRYSVSGSYTDQGSIFKNGSLKYNTYSIRSNVDTQIHENLKVGFDLNGALENGDYPAYSTSALFSRLKQIPTVPVYWPNGLPSAGMENGENPAIMATDQSGNRNIKSYRYLAKASFDLTIPWVTGLGIDGYFSYTNDVILDKNWQTPWTVYDYYESTDTYVPKLGGGILKPQLTQSYAGSNNTLVNLRIKYDLQINDHKVNTFVAVEQSEGLYSWFSAFRKNYISSTIDELFAGNLVDQSTNGSRSENARQNIFGRVSYGFQDKYLIDFNYRYDGSSNFPKGKRFGFFPGGSVAWRLSEEDFIKSNDIIDNLKLRVSIGKMGNDVISPFQNLRLYTLGNTGMSFGIPPVATNGLVAGVTPNPNITWEEATTKNIGMDADFGNGLFGFTLDVFKQRRSDILATRDLAVPVFTGLKLPNENIGIVENKGLEIELKHMKVMNDLSWRVAGNISFFRNEIIDISEAQNVPDWQKREGNPLGAEKYYKAIGIFRTQEEIDAAPIYPGTKVGDLQYFDKDGDGKISANDMMIMDKTNIPNIVFGLNVSLSYQNFNLWANFQGAGDVWQYYHMNARVAMNQLEDVIINRWTPGSMDSKYPRLPTIETRTEPSGIQSDFWLKNSSYARLKTLELSYNLPANLLSNFKIQDLKLYINGQDLFTIDNVKWADPENTNAGASHYPQMKIYNIGINVTF